MVVHLLAVFFFFNFCFCRLDDKTDAWTEIMNFQSVSDIFHSFNIDIPEDFSQKSFTGNLLEAFNLDKLVGEIRSLARRVVLCKHIKDEDKIPGTVYVYEVIVTYRNQQLYIIEMVICCCLFSFINILRISHYCLAFIPSNNTCFCTNNGYVEYNIWTCLFGFRIFKKRLIFFIEEMTTSLKLS